MILDEAAPADQLINQLRGPAMREVGAFDAKTHFSALLSQAEAGETIVITRRGKPVATLAPIAPEKPVRRFGFMQDIKVPDDFDTMGQDEIIAMFEGRG